MTGDDPHALQCPEWTTCDGVIPGNQVEVGPAKGFDLDHLVKVSAGFLDAADDVPVTRKFSPRFRGSCCNNRERPRNVIENLGDIQPHRR